MRSGPVVGVGVGAAVSAARCVLLSAGVLPVALAIGAASCANLPSAASGGQVAATPVSTADSPFGIHEVRFANPRLDETAAMKDLGARSARISPYGSLVWDLIEKERGVYDWGPSDAVLGEGYAAGISLFVGTGAQNRLEGTVIGAGSLPRDMDWYLQFLRKAAERYDGDGVEDAPGSPKIDVLQIGNEADGPAFWQDTPQNYARLLKESYQAIKQVAPSIKVAIAGVATPPGYEQFYRAVLTELERTRGGASERSFDVFDFHWSGQSRGDDDYAVMSLPDGTYPMRTFVSDVRRDLDARGYAGVPFYITEMSDYSDRPVGYPPHSEVHHAAAVLKRYVHALSCGVEKVFWAQIFEDHGAGGFADGYFDNVGLIHNPANSDGLSHRKLAYYTYKKMVELVGGGDWRSIQAVQESGYVRVYRLIKNGKPALVAWWDSATDPASASGMSISVTLSGLSGASARITELVPAADSGKDVTDYATAFKATTAAVSGGAITVTLGERPVFVESVD